VQVHYGESVANHAGPESCTAYREVCGEALTEERAGQHTAEKLRRKTSESDSQMHSGSFGNS
jgi:hypothetical protein